MFQNLSVFVRSVCLFYFQEPEGRWAERVQHWGQTLHVVGDVRNTRSFRSLTCELDPETHCRNPQEPPEVVSDWGPSWLIPADEQPQWGVKRQAGRL